MSGNTGSNAPTQGGNKPQDGKARLKEYEKYLLQEAQRGKNKNEQDGDKGGTYSTRDLRDPNRRL